MSLEMNPDTVLEKIDEYLIEVRELLEKGYSEGSEDKQGLNTRVRTFAKKAFSDSKDKLNSYTGPLVAVAGERTLREKQKDYRNKLNRMRNHLKAWREEAELEKETSKKESKIGKLEEKKRKIEAEAGRRKAVGKEKFWGAAIEMMDRLRDELKERKSIEKDMIEIKKDIADIRDMLSDMRQERE